MKEQNTDKKQLNMKVLNERGLFGLKGKLPDSVKNKPSINDDSKKKSE